MSGIDFSVMFIFGLLVSILLYILYNIINFMNDKQKPKPRNIYNFSAQENNEESEECSICTSVISNKVELDCRHFFCAKCIAEWMNRYIVNNFNCPLCRKEIRLINILNIERTDSTKDFYDDIVRYNHKNLHGYNYVIRINLVH